jgi:ParB-like chromosome segregation protein Spo0J
MALFVVIVMCPSERAPPSTMRFFAASATKRPTEHKAESIRHHGLIQPITVRPNSDGFELIAGARRYRAAKLAELFSIPARIVEIDDTQVLEWQLVENAQRADIHPYEEAQGLRFILHLDVGSVYICCRAFSATIFAV